MSSSLQVGALLVRKKALDNGMLSIHHPSKGRLGNKMFSRVVPISPELVNIIYDLAKDDTQEVDPRRWIKLESNEKRLLRSFLKYSKLSHLIREIDTGDTEGEELYKRYELLTGSILAGNNNPELLIELEQIISQLVEYDMMSNYISRKILTEIYRARATVKETK